MTARRSSLYSLRVAHPEPRLVLPRLVAALEDTGAQPTDQHTVTEDGLSYASIGFRAEGDQDARVIANGVLMLTNYWRCHTTLTTGHGVHRRNVLLLGEQSFRTKRQAEKEIERLGIAATHTPRHRAVGVYQIGRKQRGEMS